MTETTTNHNWTIPTVGGDTDQWGQILNDFFDGELDEQVTKEGLYSERPSAADGNVKLYLATDRRIVYYNDGSSWEAVYGLGTDSNPVPGTSHFESVSTEKVQTTGDDPVTTIYGDSGEYQLIGSFSLDVGSTTSDTFGPINSPGSGVPGIPALTNTTGIYAQLSARLRPETSSEIVVRVKGCPDTEFSTTSINYIDGPVGKYDGDETNIGYELKSGTAGEEVILDRGVLSILRRID